MTRIYTPSTAAIGVEDVLKLLEGRWKLVILFHLFDGKVQRYSDFERLIPAISQKMLAQQALLKWAEQKETLQPQNPAEQETSD